jgi:hypothetical protein
MMRYPESNFAAWLSDERGRIIPGSIRRGHNIFTRFGKDWLAELVRWTYPVASIDPSGSPPLVGSNDAAAGQRRLRYVMTGNPTQFYPGTDVPLEDDDVQMLKHGIPHSLAPLDYLRELPAPAFPVITTLKYIVSYGPADFAGFAVDISEFGLFVDVDSGGGPGLNNGVNTHTPVAYKTVDPPLAKNNTNTLNIKWELRF